MGFDLRTRIGWGNLFTQFKSAWRCGAYAYPPVKTVLSDTFMPVVCFVKGHREYDSGNSGYWGELACNRCWHYIGKPPKDKNEGHKN
jgi:hypothetical protein